MPIHGMFTHDEKYSMSYELAMLFLRLKGEPFDTPEQFMETFLDVQKRIQKELPTER